MTLGMEARRAPVRSESELFAAERADFAEDFAVTDSRDESDFPCRPLRRTLAGGRAGLSSAAMTLFFSFFFLSEPPISFPPNLSSSWPWRQPLSSYPDEPPHRRATRLSVCPASQDD